MSPEMEKTIAEFQTFRAAFVDGYLRSAGLSERELTARDEQIPEPIQKILPTNFTFGLSGGFGVGKTFAIASMARRYATKSVDRLMTRMIEKADYYALSDAMRTGRLLSTPNLAWVNFPEESTRSRARLFGTRQEQQEVEPWIEGTLLDHDRILILDDIGTDRATAADWVGELLGRVVDERLRWGSSLVWTSNLTEAGLIERYGPRTFSRLQLLAPAIQVPKLPDLRLQKRGTP
jgi:DNA replication protein DnaC